VELDVPGPLTDEPLAPELDDARRALSGQLETEGEGAQHLLHHREHLARGHRGQEGPVLGLLGQQGQPVRLSHRQHPPLEDLTSHDPAFDLTHHRHPPNSTGGGRRAAGEPDFHRMSNG